MMCRMGMGHLSGLMQLGNVDHCPASAQTSGTRGRKMLAVSNESMKPSLYCELYRWNEKSPNQVLQGSTSHTSICHCAVTVLSLSVDGNNAELIRWYCCSSPVLYKHRMSCWRLLVRPLCMAANLHENNDSIWHWFDCSWLPMIVVAALLVFQPCLLLFVHNKSCDPRYNCSAGCLTWWAVIVDC